MRTPNYVGRLVLLTATLVTLISLHEGRAQSLDFPPLDVSRMGIEVMKGNFEDVEGISTISSIWYIDIQEPLPSGEFAFIFEVPMAIYDEKDFQSVFGPITFDAQIMIGNPLVAMEFRSSGNGLGGYGWFGIRPPIVSEDNDDAQLYGLLTDFDRLDAFLTNYVSILGGGGWRGELSKSADGSIQFHFGLSGLELLATENYVESEFFLKYHAQFWYIMSQFSYYIGYNGVALVSDGDLDLGERTESQLTLGVRGNFGQVSPGAFIRFPLEKDLNDILSFVGGVNLLINLPGTQ